MFNTYLTLSLVLLVILFVFTVNAELTERHYEDFILDTILNDLSDNAPIETIKPPPQNSKSYYISSSCSCFSGDEFYCTAEPNCSYCGKTKECVSTTSYCPID
mmetsp:Transcript_12950/g.19516  ORF Transcript_12950/g.19516 Transcript_12950/m.19516 type:complete len:103 (-) Transcript_12950:427-735(-)